MAEHAHIDPQAWLAEFRRYQAARLEKALQGDTLSVGIQAYIQRAVQQSRDRAPLAEQVYTDLAFNAPVEGAPDRGTEPVAERENHTARGAERQGDRERQERGESPARTAQIPALLARLDDREPRQPRAPAQEVTY